MARHIDLPEDDPDTFEKLVQFWYTGGYVDGILQLEGEDYQSIASHLTHKRVLTELGTPGEHHTWESRGQRSRNDSEAYAREYPAPVSSSNISEELYRTSDAERTELVELIQTTAKVYKMADKFLVHTLKLLALNRFTMVQSVGKERFTT